MAWGLKVDHIDTEQDGAIATLRILLGFAHQNHPISMV